MKSKKLILSAGFVLLIIALTASMAVSTDSRIKAPDFPKGLQWLNSAPLSLQDLRGKVVLMDFWTYCCINCMHIIPDLKKLEHKYANELVVIGVHSAKFDNEKDTDNIREAILRYGLEHPVVNDNKFEIWREYGVQAWPTLVLIDPEGYAVAAMSGEDIYDKFDRQIGDLVAQYDARGLINRTPLKLRLEKDKTLPTLLSFPGKLAIDKEGNRLFVTDSDNNRVLIIGLDDGLIKDAIGGSQGGFVDGDYASARFFHPQGIAYDPSGNVLYVADTENHAIRRIDLQSQKVTTIAGTGKQARAFNDEGIGTKISLNSPWDLLINNGKLYIAMAGSHQIWTIDLATDEARVFAGTGREGLTDGPRLKAELAQPSGITTDGHYLYFADSEGSAVRRVAIQGDGDVETLIGTGLFDFGDIDGRYPKARFQHPIGVAYHDGYVYVADTYNDKIKQLDPATKEVKTLIGTGKKGTQDGPAAKAELNEPNGLVFAGGKMYITDTNNHLIRIYDPGSGDVSTLHITPQALASASEQSDEFNGEIETFDPITIAPSAEVFDLEIDLPEGTKFYTKAPFKIKVTSDHPEILTVGKFEAKEPAHHIKIPIMAMVGQASLTVDLYFDYCTTGDTGLCYFKDVRLQVPVTIAASGLREFKTRYLVMN